MIETILKNTKLLLMISDDSKDEILILHIEMTIQSMKNYCNRSDLPEELWFLAAKLAAESYRSASKTTTSGEITSIKEGDRTVSFSAGAAQTRLSQVVSQNSELNKFRKIYYE